MSWKSLLLRSWMTVKYLHYFLVQHGFLWLHYSDRNQLANLITLLEQQKLQPAEKSRSATPSTVDSDFVAVNEGENI
jgi:hypothetical protein